jgi:Ca-activated chloride channel homolog
MRRYVLEGFAILLVIFGISTAGYAGSKSNLILIFDASGSMWGQIDGKNKIVIAKEAMDLIVNDLPQNMNVGLVAYGHRRKGDCDDVQTLIPLSPLNAEQFLAKINDLTPKGKTPMVRSIRKTAEAIKHLEDETTILLVSDGEETCDPNPCNFVAELKKMDIKFVLHVVGFDVGGNTEKQLKCMAKAGGGEYFPASNAKQLVKSLDTVIKKVVDTNLHVYAYKDGRLYVAMAHVYDSTGKPVANQQTFEGEPAKFKLPAGTYRIQVEDVWGAGELKDLGSVTVQDESVAETRAEFSFGEVHVYAYRAGKLYVASAALFDANGKKLKTSQTFEDGPAKFKVPAGTYRVVVEDTWGTQMTTDLGSIVIQGNQVSKAQADFNFGKLFVYALRGGKPYVANAYVYDMAGKKLGNSQTYGADPAKFDLMPGNYQVKLKDEWGDGTIRKQNVVVPANQTLKIKIDLAASQPPLKNFPGQAPQSQSQRSQISGAQAQTVAGPPKQTGRETIPQQSAPTAQNPQDMQAMANQMQAAAQVQAAQAQADAISQMQKALAGMQGIQLPQTPAQQAQVNGQNALPTPGGQQADTNKSPKNIQLPKVADSQAGYSIQQPTADDAGAKPIQHLGALPSTVDYSNVGAQDTGGGLTPENERPEQGHNPYEGMTKEQMQVAFASDMGMQGPQGQPTAFNPDEFKVGNPLTTVRHIDTLDRRLKTYKNQAQSMNRADILSRIETAQKNIKYLRKQLKKRAPKKTLQQLLTSSAQESHAIKVSLLQAQ